MNKVYIISKGHNILLDTDHAEEVFKIHKVFRNESDAIKEAKAIFINNLRTFFESEKSECDNEHFKDFDDFFNKCSKETYHNKDSKLNNFFISFISDYYYYGFEDDELFKKPDFSVKVESHYIS